MFSHTLQERWTGTKADILHAPSGLSSPGKDQSNYPCNPSNADQETADIQPIAEAHQNCLGRNLRYSEFSTDGNRIPMYSRCSTESSNSTSSNGLSLQTLKPPVPLLLTSRYNPLADYKSIATTFTPLAGGHECDRDYLKAGLTLQKPSECFGHKIALPAQLDALVAARPLPGLTGAKWKRDARYVYLSAYRRLWAITILINVATITAMLYKPGNLSGGFTYQQAATATGANFLVAAFGRQEHVINLLFRLACLMPRWTPLRIRKEAAQVYSYGGLHSGCGISAFFWYLIFTVLLVKQFEGIFAESAALGPTTAVILAVLLLVLVSSHPRIRKRWHNHWELSHRYGGWTAILLSWAQTFIMVIAQARRAHEPVLNALIKSPTFWILQVISTCLIYPWIRLRRRKVEAEKLSSHAVRLWFKDKKLPTCVGHRLSHFPLGQNHGFAIIPNSDGQQGYSVVVSNAGDWTQDLIENPPEHIWTRGAPTTGVLRIATLFRPIILVATGSGIGPLLSLVQVHPDHPMRIIWSARSPELTYGCRIMNAVLQADMRAVIIDTKKTGHPNLVSLTYAMCQEIRAEAVVVISNASVTTQLVYELETRRIAAFGPIFDS